MAALGTARKRKARDFHNLFILTALGIVRESAKIVLKHLSFFTSITSFLILPVSAATIISKAFADHLPVTQLARQIQALCFTLGYPKLIYEKLSETMISYMVCFPFVVTFSVVAKAAVVHTVAYIHAGGSSPSWQKIIQALPKLWKGLVVTYIWGCLIIFGYSVLIFGFLLATIDLAILVGLSANWVFWSGLCWMIVYSIGFAHAIVVCNLATIVCVLEDGCYGLEAICRAKFLIKGRTQVALLIVVITSLGLAFVEGLFHYRVIANYGLFCFGAVSEASLLIFMYSVVSLSDVVMNCVFYYTCMAARLEGLSLNSSFFANLQEEELSSSSHKIFVTKFFLNATSMDICSDNVPMLLRGMVVLFGVVLGLLPQSQRWIMKFGEKPRQMRKALISMTFFLLVPTLVLHWYWHTKYF